MYTWFRHSVVGVGPPYRTCEKEHEDCPIWSCMQMLDATLDKKDWQRTYGFAARKVGKVQQDWAFRGAQLGPERSIRQISLHAQRSQSAGARDRLPPVNRRGGRRRGKDDRAGAQSVPPGKGVATATPSTPAAKRPATPEDTMLPSGGTAITDAVEVLPLSEEPKNAAETKTAGETQPKKKRDKVKLS